jgi:biotin carboxyl carrier protein
MKEKNRRSKKEKYIACTPKNKKYEIVNPLEQRVKIRGKRHDLKLVEDEKGFSYIVFKNKKYHVEILEKNQNKYIVMINGVWHSFSIETPISYKRRKTLSKNGSASRVENVMAPMPGKVVDIMVEENSDIKEGEPILILEAMKMQNEIVANVNGRIRKVNIKNNDSVMKDEVMIEIEKG